MAIIHIGNVEVVVRSRGEHCPPHVHADCSPEGWSARFKFFFTLDDVMFWDFQPDNPQREPSASRLDGIGLAISQNLARIRQRWWEVMATTCLENQYVHQTANGLLVIENKRLRKGLPKVRSATYEPATQTVTVILTNGTSYKEVL